MKRVLLAFSALTIVLSAVIFSGCKKSTEELIGTLSGTVDGKEWKSNFRIGYKTDSSIVIVANKGLSYNSGEMLVLTMRGTTEGTYQLKPTGLAVKTGTIYTSNYSVSIDSTFFSTSGTATISKLDSENKRIDGSFDFQATSAKLGSMNIKGTFTNVKYGGETLSWMDGLIKKYTGGTK